MGSGKLQEYGDLRENYPAPAKQKRLVDVQEALNTIHYFHSVNNTIA